MQGQSSKKRLRVEGKQRVTGTLMKIDLTKNEVTLKNKRGEELIHPVSPKLAEALKRLKHGAVILLVQADVNGSPKTDDVCWRIGNSACGGSQNDPCDTSEERRIYYKCVDEDGNELYYDECETDGCAKRTPPTH
jgi:hypothetical protein